MKKISILFMLLSVWFVGHSDLVQAQAVTKNFTTKGIVVDENDKPFASVTVFSSTANKYAITDAEGRFSIEVAAADYISINIQGYAKTVISCSLGRLDDERIVLKPWSSARSGDKIDIANGKYDFDRLTGSVSVISGDELKDMPSFNMIEALTGKVAGLRISPGTTKPGEESYGMSLRGSGIGDIRVDGVPGSSADMVDEIDQIVIAKDLAGSSLFGSTSHNGAMMVKTKRGFQGEGSVNVRYNHGFRQAAFLPDMMDAGAFARLYDQGLKNDGLNPKYGETAYAAYASGVNPIRHPNINYYDYFLKNITNYDQVSANFSGGSRTVKYFSNLNYYATDGLEKVNTPTYNRLRLRTNLYVNVTDYAILDIGIGGNFGALKNSNLDGNSLFNSMYTYPQNANPFIIGKSSDGKDIYGYNLDYPSNMLVQQAYSGTEETSSRSGYSRVGINLDLEMLMKGLSFDAYANISVFDSEAKKLEPTATTSRPLFSVSPKTGKDTLTFQPITVGAPDNSWARSGGGVVRDYFYYANLNYDRSFGENHKLTANLSFSRRNGNASTYEQDDRQQSYGLRVNYFHKNKYVLEGSAVNSGLQSLSKENRMNWAYNGGIGWIISRENFMKKASWIDYLKLRANYGQTGVYFGMLISNDGDGYYLYKDLYTNAGGYTFGISGKTSSIAASYRKEFTGNPNLDWSKKQMLNIGFDMRMLKNKLQMQMNYFTQKYYDLLSTPVNITALMGGMTDYLYFVNYDDVSSRSLDVDIKYSNRIGKFSYVIGANAIYTVSKYNKVLEVPYPQTESYRNNTGQTGGKVYGLSSAGIFTSQADIDASPKQYFGNVQVGDIKYVDFNRDGVVDIKDIHPIANGSRLYYGLNFTVKYSDFSLSVRGEGVGDGQFLDTRRQFSGSDNYLKSMAEAYPAGNNLPRASIMGITNNNQSSDFWLSKSNYFNLKSVYLTYSLPTALAKKAYVQSAQVHVGGKNLFVLSPLDDAYAPSRNKGYSEYPVLNAVELGIDLSF